MIANYVLFYQASLVFENARSKKLIEKCKRISTSCQKVTRLLNELWLQRGANTPKCRVCVPFARASEERKVASVTGHHLWRYKFFQFSSSHASQFTHCSHTSVCCLAAHIPKVAHTHNPLYHNRRSLPGTYDSEWEALESGCVVVSLLKKLNKDL